MIRSSLAILVAASLTLAAHAQSLPQKPDKPKVQTQIESVRLRVQNDGEKAYFHFIDAVVLNATNMYIECDSLEVFAIREAENQETIGKFGAIQEIIATGNVRIVQEERTAKCDKAIVQPNKERIVLSGAPAIVEQTGGTITSDEIILNRANGRITFDGTTKRKIRLLGPAIGDLGFEQKQAVPAPLGEDATDLKEPAAADETPAADPDAPAAENTTDSPSE